MFELYDSITLQLLQGDSLSVLSMWPGPKVAWLQLQWALGSATPSAKVPVCQELV